MPWKETDTMKERHLLISDYLRGESTITTLSLRYGVSRKTIYKWIERYEEEGFEGLTDRSRAPQGIPHRTDAAHLDILEDVKAHHPSWGPRKIVKYLERTSPELDWPVPSTVATGSRNEGLFFLASGVFGLSRIPSPSKVARHRMRCGVRISRVPSKRAMAVLAIR